MGRKSAIIPKMRNVNGYARVFVNGKPHYLGKFGTPEADEAYRSFVARHAANPNAPAIGPSSILTHLIGDFLKSPDSPDSPEKKRQVAFLINHLGELALRQVEHVTAQDLKALFKAKAEETRPVKGKPTEREPRYGKTTLRLWLANLKRVYLWAIESQRVGGAVVAPILAIRKLPIQAARDERDVEPVPREHVEATLPKLTPTVAAMVRLQLLTGMRPSDLFNMTGSEIYRGGTHKFGGVVRDLDKEGVWVYCRAKHKTARYGHARVIVLGDEERAIIEPRLNRAANVPLFTPEESLAESYRRTKLDGGRRRAGARPYNQKFTRQAYAKAVERAAVKASVPHWSPYQIRHTVSVETQAEYDLDTARAKLGQKNLSVAARYAGHDFNRAANTVKRKPSGS